MILTFNVNVTSDHVSPVTSVSSDTEASLDLPHLDTLVPAAAEDVVTRGQEGDTADIVVVAVHGLDTLV